MGKLNRRKSSTRLRGVSTAQPRLGRSVYTPRLKSPDRLAGLIWLHAGGTYLGGCALHIFARHKIGSNTEGNWE